MRSADQIAPSTARLRSSHAQLVAWLGAAIVHRRYHPGQFLPVEAELMARFGISRTVLREALKTLTAKGLVRAKTKVGTWVLDRSHWNMFDPDVIAWHCEGGADASFLTDLADVRRAIEPRAAALAAERRTDADLARLRADVDAMRTASSGSNAYAKADLQFHIDIANTSANPFMRSIGAVIEAALLASLSASSPDSENERLASVAAHGAIVDAIARRDGEGAATAMLSVILDGRSRLPLNSQALNSQPLNSQAAVAQGQ